MGAVASALCFCFSATSCACSAMSCLCGSALNPNSGVTTAMAKLFYVIMLGISSAVALVLLDQDLDCDFFDDVTIVCNGAPAVYRLSLALVMLFTVMFVGTIYVPTFTGSKRWGPLLGEGFHRGWWSIKMFLYVAASVGSLFIGDSFDDQAYAQVSRVVSAVFLFLQVVSLIDFAYQWNEDWVWRAFEGGDEPVSRGWMYGVLGSALVLYILAAAGIVILFVEYSDCKNAVTFTTITLIAIVAFTAITLFRDRIVGEEHQGAVLPAAVMAVYTSFQCWSAVSSSPEPACRSNDETFSIVMGAVFAVVSLMWISYTVSKRASNLITGRETEEPVDEAAQQEMGQLYRVQGADGNTVTAAEENGNSAAPAAADRSTNANGTKMVGDTTMPEAVSGDRAYLFHFFMVTASMYMAMLFTNWGTRDENAPSTVGNFTMWVKIIAQWMAIALFTWTLLAPRVLGNREF